MKVGLADCIWACISLVIVGVSFHFGMLLYGIIVIYLLMVGLFLWHIHDVKKRLSRTVAVFGKITEYRTAFEVGKRCYPVVEYETEEGELIEAVYSVSDTKQRYKVGDEEMVCYDPDDPMFFYFANRENDMTRDYYRFIMFGCIPAAAALIYIITH